MYTKRRRTPMEKISFIIPCYNSSKTVGRTINSILAQDYNNIEIICVNDGSKDNTLEVLNNLATTDNRIKIIDKPNGGVSTARNLGLTHATGELIEFMDSDDYFLNKDAISHNLELMKKHNVNVVIFNFTHPCFALGLHDGILDLSNPRDFKTFYKDFFALSMPWNKLFKREVLTGTYTEGVAFAEDELYNIDNLPNYKKVYISTRVDYNYTCNSSTSAINQTLGDSNLLKTQNTIWYKGNKNKPLRDGILSKNFPTKSRNLGDIRTFDYLMFDIEFMCFYDLPENILAGEIYRVTKEPDFLLAVKRLFKITQPAFTEEKITQYAYDCKKIYKDLFNSNELSKITKTLINKFLEYFTN